MISDSLLNLKMMKLLINKKSHCGSPNQAANKTQTGSWGRGRLRMKRRKRLTWVQRRYKKHLRGLSTAGVFNGDKV